MTVGPATRSSREWQAPHWHPADSTAAYTVVATHRRWRSYWSSAPTGTDTAQFRPRRPSDSPTPARQSAIDYPLQGQEVQTARPPESRYTSTATRLPSPFGQPATP